MLKRFYIVGLYTAPAPPGSARDYYISAAGTGNAATSGTPGPESILHSAQFTSGDHISFNKGDTI